MMKFLSALLFSFLFFIILISPSQVQAEIVTAPGAASFSNLKFKVNAFIPDDPQKSQKIRAGYDLWISVTALEGDVVKTDLFTGSHKYYYLINSNGKNCINLVSSQTNTATGQLSIGKDNDIWRNVSEDIKDSLCTDGISPGTFNIKVWMDDEEPNSSNILIDEKNAKFTVDTTQGGKETSLQHFNGDKYICRNKVTKVVIVNALNAQDYTFWWDGAIVNKAAGPVRFSENNSTNVVDLTDAGFTWANPKAKLCVQKGTAVPVLASAARTCIDYDVVPNDSSPLCKTDNAKKCTVTVQSLGSNTKDKQVNVVVNGLENTIKSYTGTLTDGAGTAIGTSTNRSTATGSVGFNFGDYSKPIPTGKYTFTLPGFCTAEVEVDDKVSSPPTGLCTTDGSNGNKCSNAAGSSLGCPVEKTKFGERTYISTAIGCIPTDPNTLINSLMTWAAGFAGGIALLLMISGSYQMVASQGNPDAIKKGREQFVSAVVGLLFIIFSVTLLRIIGVDILQIPGFKP